MKSFFGSVFWSDMMAFPMGLAGVMLDHRRGQGALLHKSAPRCNAQRAHDRTLPIPTPRRLPRRKTHPLNTPPCKYPQFRDFLTGRPQTVRQVADREPFWEPLGSL